MSTRTPPAVKTEQMRDEARFSTGICEPFTLQIRRLGESAVKLIWWYIGAVDDGELVRYDLREKGRYAVEFYNYSDVLEELTFQVDSHMVKRAIDLDTDTYRS